MRKYVVRLIIIAFILISTGSLLACRNSNEIEIQPAPRQEITGRVFISGSVMMPGYYPLKNSDNLTTLIEAVAGASSDADFENMRLYIPATGETTLPQKIDINRAESWLLAALPGIGEVTARRIVDYRENNGPFRNVDDLKRVEGIGQATLDKIKNLVTLAE